MISAGSAFGASGPPAWTTCAPGGACPPPVSTTTEPAESIMRLDWTAPERQGEPDPEGDGGGAEGDRGGHRRRTRGAGERVRQAEADRARQRQPSVQPPRQAAPAGARGTPDGDRLDGAQPAGPQRGHQRGTGDQDESRGGHDDVDPHGTPTLAGLP